MKMEYNGEALKSYANSLNKNFISLRNTMNDIETTIKSLTSTNTWDAKTRDYFLSMVENIYANFDILNNRYMNINQYLDNVISSYEL